MRTTLAVLLLAGAAACGGTRAPDPPPMTAEDHLAEAERKETQAVALDEQAAEAGSSAAPDYACGDDVLADQVTSGGERIITQSACLPPSNTPEQLRARARKLRDEAAEHRAAARQP